MLYTEHVLVQRYDTAVVWNPFICSVAFMLLFIFRGKYLRESFCAYKKGLSCVLPKFSLLRFFKGGRATSLMRRIKRSVRLVVVCEFLHNTVRLTVMICHFRHYIHGDTEDKSAVQELQLWVLLPYEIH